MATKTRRSNVPRIFVLGARITKHLYDLNIVFRHTKRFGRTTTANLAAIVYKAVPVTLNRARGPMLRTSGNAGLYVYM